MVLGEVFGPKWEEVTLVHVLNVSFAYHILLGKDL